MKEESMNELKSKIVSTYKKLGDKKGLVTKGRSYTGNELAKEIEDETELGVKIIANMIMLTIDLVSRDKINSQIE